MTIINQRKGNEHFVGLIHDAAACNRLSSTSATIEEWKIGVKLFKLLNGKFFIRPKSELL
jgi:hypothetical protein